MANPEHLKKLLEERETWNAWYTTHKAADFTAADLRKANLSWLDLQYANFSDADLSGASLLGADCTGANFTGANLRHANLVLANLHQVTLDSADLSEAQFGLTSVGGTKLRNTRLNVHHEAASSIGIDSFFDNGGLPEEFLRGCGVPEEFIAYAGSLIGKPIEYYSCFISYSSKDDDFAHRLHADLQARKIRTWFAPEDLKIGDRFRSRIDESIRVHDKLVLILSENSINSAWVQREVETALEREDKEKRDLLFPIRLDDSVFNSDAAWARDVCRRHIGDFRNWKNHDDYTKAFNRLVKDLKKEGPIIMR